MSNRIFFVKFFQFTIMKKTCGGIWNEFFIATCAGFFDKHGVWKFFFGNCRRVIACWRSNLFCGIFWKPQTEHGDRGRRYCNDWNFCNFVGCRLQMPYLKKICFPECLIFNWRKKLTPAEKFCRSFFIFRRYFIKQIFLPKS